MKGNISVKMILINLVWLSLMCSMLQAQTINDIHAFDATTALIIGNDGSAFGTTDAGNTWNLLSHPTNNELKAVYFVNRLMGWSVGTVGTIFNTIDGGLHWAPVYSGVTTDINACFFYDSLIGWAVGKGGTILKTTNGGFDWFNLTSSTSLSLSTVFFVTPEIGWVGGVVGTVAKTTDGGNSWIQQSSGTTYNLYSSWFADSLRGVLVGELARIRKTTDGGQTWDRINLLTSASFYSVFFVNPSIGWAAGSGGTIFKTTDAGTSWFAQTTSVGNTLFSVNFIDTLVGWAVGDVRTILHTTDGGTNWVQQKLYPPLEGQELIRYTSVGNIGLGVTNVATIGTKNAYWPVNPSCEYPKRSGVEHLYQGGLWIGALMKTVDPFDIRNNQFLVSTGSHDRSSIILGANDGYEFTPVAGVFERSSLQSSAYYDSLAVSHQDFLATFTDRYTRNPSSGDTIFDHLPLGVNVSMKSHAWEYSNMDNFVIIKYTITNASLDTLDSVYLGLWDNAAVRNTNLVRPGTPGYFDHCGYGYDSLYRISYSFDFDGIPGTYPADSYIGIKLLGTTPFPSDINSSGELFRHTYYNAWRFRSSSGEQVFFSPDQDGGSGYTSRYYRMSQSMPVGDIERLRRTSSTGGVAPLSAVTLLSTGPISRLNPGDSTEVVFAVICAKKKGTAPARDDIPDQRQFLIEGGQQAQALYENGFLVGVGVQENQFPTGFMFDQNYPNPFNPVTAIRFEIPASGFVSLRVYDVLGREVATLVDEKLSAGTHLAQWNASGYASGVYFYRVEAVDASNPSNSFTQVKKMLLLK